MLRVRVTARNFTGLVPTGDPPKKEGAPIPRHRIRYPKDSEISVSEAFYERHKSALHLLGRDVGEDAGRGKTADETVDDLDALRAQAKQLGIEVDKRWRSGRLTAEIEAKRAELDGEGPDDDA